MKILNTLLAALILGGCSLLPENADKTKDWSAQQLYAEAKGNLDSQNYTTALEFYSTLTARYPFGRYAQQAELDTIYAHYKDFEPALAIAAADRFIKAHPSHPFVDYAYYLRALSSFTRGSGIIERLTPTNLTKTDVVAGRQAFSDFEILVRKFPDSKYATDARQRMVFIRNNLAQYELHVANWYMRREAYLAAANRGKYVLENYSRTNAVPEALAYMVRGYRDMGMNDLADDSLRVLQENTSEADYTPVMRRLLEGKKVKEPSMIGELLGKE